MREFWELLGPLRLWIALTVFFVFLAVAIDYWRVRRRLNHVADVLAGSVGGLFSNSIRVRTEVGECTIVISRGGRYSLPFIAFMCGISASFRAQARRNLTGHRFNLMPTLPVQCDVSFAGTSYCVGVEKDYEGERIGSAFSALGSALAIHEIFGLHGPIVALNIDPDRNFWMKKLPHSSTILLKPFPYKLGEESQKMKAVLDAFVLFVASVAYETS